MQCVHVKAFGKPEDVISIKCGAPVPEPKKGQVLVKVKACSLAFGDAGMMQGLLKVMLTPPSWPYVPGMDVCGEVVQTHASSHFAVGDVLVATNGLMPIGGLAEYAAVDEKHAAKKPAALPVLESAAAPVSAMTAMLAVEQAKVEAGERVLVLGGSGGVGSALVQFARRAGAGYVAATSTDRAMLEGIGCDRVIDYRSENWWEVDDFVRSPFDVVFDCVKGYDWPHAQKAGVKKGAAGRYIAISFLDVHAHPLHGAWQVLGMMRFVLWQTLRSRLSSSMPRWRAFMSEPKAGDLDRLLQVLANGEVRIVLEKGTPYAFTQDGVVAAFQQLVGGHAHGKVVIQVSPE